MSYTILVADDSAIVRTMVKKAIAMAGLPIGQVHEAANGEEALAILRKNWIDVVFADINMPVMTGPELIRQMKGDAALASTPVVIVSSERSPARVEEMHKCGARAYVKKPFRPEQFRAVVEELLQAGEGPHGR
ncbi:response regulator [Anaeromyxobacter diazotrophicus]|uniref:Response regulator n=1 Tax=Anaeromyxobacter diazotrophicus TaxID=2590199 RepID=A0A7I9VS13_9BACT|nr:response regulator [Anaeromyxobacter diazotrophicus]GEJ59226.1 response regulator [Anaeromyxobacter diazotrophicus]